MNKNVKKYLRRVRSWLPCTRRMKNDIMARVEDGVLSWAQENPRCSYTDIENQFGKPERIAADYVDNMGTEELLRNLHAKKKIITIVTAAVAAVVLIWAVSIGIVMVDHMLNTHNSYTITTYTDYEIGD